MLLVELSGENPPLALAECEGALAAISAGPVVDQDDGVALADAPADAARPLAARLALAHRVSEHWATVAADDSAILRALQRDLGPRTFAVRARRVNDHHPHLSTTDLERRGGRTLTGAGADLDAPDIEARIIVSRRAHLARHLADVDRPAYEARAVKNRPFFSPISLHPRFARALVNLARVRPGDRVLDPFCGTGGVALEAALVGAEVHAGDIDARMVAGTAQVLAHYGHHADVQDRDVGEAPDWAPDVHAVVTDPPYGRSTSTAKEDLADLYRRFLNATTQALRPDGRLAMTVPDPALLAGAPDDLATELAIPHKVHASLTRTFVVMRRRR